MLCGLGTRDSLYTARRRRDRCVILPFRSSVHRRRDHFTLRRPARGNMAPKRTYRHILYPVSLPLSLDRMASSVGDQEHKSRDM